ncbi:MAG TPA: GNAT family N-acetyltransferase [bacterium]
MVILQTNAFTIRTVEKDDFPAILKVYKQSEDFLALGPMPNASIEMVLKDIKHSKEEKGEYCGIWDLKGNLMGIVDFIPILEDKESSFLSLIMISTDYRDKGLGGKVVQALESHLTQKYLVKGILSAVQTNNRKAIRFWKRCGYIVETIPEKRHDETVIFKMKKAL